MPTGTMEQAKEGEIAPATPDKLHTKTHAPVVMDLPKTSRAVEALQRSGGASRHGRGRQALNEVWGVCAS